MDGFLPILKKVSTPSHSLNMHNACAAQADEQDTTLRSSRCVDWMTPNKNEQNNGFNNEDQDPRSQYNVIQ